MPEFIAEHTPDDIDPFTRGYLDCAEWLLDEEIERDNIKGWSEEAIKQAKRDCADFIGANAFYLEQYMETNGRDEYSAGMDFWLTRNHHGAGFWDRGSEPVFAWLTGFAHSYDETDAYLGDDNLIYLS